MRKCSIVMLSAVVLAFAAPGWPQENASGVSASDAVGARQASMDMSLLALRSIEGAMKAGGEAKSQGFPAAVLAKWAKVLPHLFPAGTGMGDTSAETQALPTVSRDRAGFERAAAKYAVVTARLADLAAANDTPAFTKQLEAVNQACDSCHAVYKQPLPAAHGKKP
jgi:cytochrome c556